MGINHPHAPRGLLHPRVEPHERESGKEKDGGSERVGVCKAERERGNTERRTWRPVFRPFFTFFLKVLAQNEICDLWQTLSWFLWSRLLAG